MLFGDGGGNGNDNNDGSDGRLIDSYCHSSINRFIYIGIPPFGRKCLYSKG
jgi:hypothetical protein